MPKATAARERSILYDAAMVRALLAGRKTQTRRVFANQPRPGRRPGEYLMTVSKRTTATNRIHRVVTDRSTKPAVVLEDREFDLDLPEWLAEMCPLGQVGDRIYVRENWRTHERPTDLVDGFLYQADGAFKPIEDTFGAAERWMGYHTVKARPKGLKPIAAAGGKLVAWCNPPHGDRWRPSIHMPRDAARIVLTIAAVRAERVQDITQEDAQAEGVYRDPGGFWTVGDDGYHATPRCCFAAMWDRTNPGSLAWDANPWTSVVTFEAEVAAHG